jgi:uncharacterized protein
MARPPKERRIEYIPEVKLFKPAGTPMRKISEISLTMEEVEAIRLKDKEGLTQEECAFKMEVSRPTFQRVLTGARGKIAEALIEGKAIRFQGGDYRLAKRRYRCYNCGYEFERPMFHGRGRSGLRYRGMVCPNCGANLVRPIKEE